MHDTPTEFLDADSGAGTTSSGIRHENRPAAINFSTAVTRDGYLWWYVDAISDDGTQAMTLIMFIGSVFSPYYASARRRGRGEPENHCAFNTILYGPGSRKRWSMTERSQKDLARTPERLCIGPSQAHWDGERLIMHVDERCTPVPLRMHGRITVTPAPLTGHSLWLDRRGRHRWHPLAPRARVVVHMQSPQLRWEGHGYLDSNEGKEPLASGFHEWDWSRERLPDGDCRVRYETRSSGGQQQRLTLRFDAGGKMHQESVTSERTILPTTPVWRIRRHTLSDPQLPSPNIVRTLEDTPFYARSLMARQRGEEKILAVHESLDLRRFEQRWVQTLLPFRMPRR